MNILYINHYAGSPRMGMEFRPYYLSREWIKMGHNVTIVAASYSHLRKENPKIERDFQEEMIDGIRYVWVKTDAYNGNGVARAKTMYQFVHKLRKKAELLSVSIEPDIIITSSTYPLDTYAGQKLKKLNPKAVLIHEVHDLWPLTPMLLGGMSKNNPFIRIMQRAENSAYCNSNYVVSLVPLGKKYMVQHGLKAYKFVNITNGVALGDWESPCKLPKTMEKRLCEIKNQNKFVVGYLGGHAISNALEDLIEVAYRIDDNDFHFVLIGDGVEKAKLVEKAKNLKLDNIDFFESIPKYCIPTVTKYFDCGYIGAKASPLYEFGICMNKIFDYMAGKLPIICAVTTPVSQVSESNCGICVDSSDIEGIIGGLNTFKHMDKEELKSIGENGYNAVISKYEYRYLAGEFSKFFTMREV